MKIVMNFAFRSRRARLSVAVSLRFGFFTTVSLSSSVNIDRRKPNRSSLRADRTRHGLFIGILRRRFADPLDDTRVGHGWDCLFDPLDLNLMKPVVTKVKPI